VSTPSHSFHPFLIHLTETFGSGYPRKMERNTSKLKRWGRTLSGDKGGGVESRAPTGHVATSAGGGGMGIAQGWKTHWHRESVQENEQNNRYTIAQARHKQQENVEQDRSASNICTI